MILVVGATGVLGGLITKNLLAKDKQVRILVRSNSPCEELAKQGMATSAQALIQLGAQASYGDLKDRLSLERACQGVDTVITTAASTLRDFDIEGVDLNGTKLLVDVAKAAGVKHFIYTSAHAGNLNSPNPLLKIKAILSEYVKNSGMPYTILSPGIFMEIWIGMVIGMPLRAGQPVTLVGKGDHKHSMVSIKDVAAFASAAVDNPNAINQTIYIGGPASYTWTEITRVVGGVVGQDLAINYVSFTDPIPLLPEGIPDMLRAMETFETHIDMSATAASYGVGLTSLEEFAQGFFAVPASR